MIGLGSDKNIKRSVARKVYVAGQVSGAHLPQRAQIFRPSTPRLQLKCLDLNLTERCHKSGGGEFRQIAHRLLCLLP